MLARSAWRWEGGVGRRRVGGQEESEGWRPHLLRADVGCHPVSPPSSSLPSPAPCRCGTPPRLPPHHPSPHLRRADVGRRPVSPPIIPRLTCAVQMWDAALSRRMCCSRVCVAMRRRARMPCASTGEERRGVVQQQQWRLAPPSSDTPRLGSLRSCAPLAAKQPACGPLEQPLGAPKQPARLRVKPCCAEPTATASVLSLLACVRSAASPSPRLLRLRSEQAG